MATVNKNFVIKHGLEVDTNTLVVDATNNRVGINTSTPSAQLDVNGAANIGGSNKVSIGGDGGRNIEIGVGNTSTPSYIDFRTADNVDADYTARIERGGGINGSFAFAHKGTGSFSFSNTGIELLVLSASGNVGIGTPNPTRKLHVVGTSLFTSNVGIGTAINIVPYDNLDNGTIAFEGSAGQLFAVRNNLTSGSIFSVNDVSGIPSIDVDANGTIELAPFGGNVGIGTTNPVCKTHIVGSGDILAIESTGTNDRSTLRFLTNGSDWEVGARGSAASPANSFYIYDNAASQYRQVIDSSGNVLLGTGTATGTASQTLQVTGGAYISGNVGIGRTNPGVKLEVAGVISLLSTNTSAVGSLSASDTGAYTITSYYATGATMRFVLTDSAGNNQERVRFDAAGNVGIGTTNPTSLLQLGASGTSSYSYLKLTGGGATNRFYRFIAPANKATAAGVADAAQSLYVGRFYNGVHKIQMYVSGNNLEEGISLTLFREWGVSAVPVFTTEEGSDLLEINFHYQNIDNDAYHVFISFTWVAQAPINAAANIILDITSISSIGTFDLPTTPTIPTLNASNQILQRFLIASGGNVGIGTTNPTSQLYLRGGTDPVLDIIQTTSSSARWILKARSIGIANDTGIWQDASNNLQFVARDGSSNVRVLLDSRGDSGSYVNTTGGFGVGTSSVTTGYTTLATNLRLGVSTKSGTYSHNGTTTITITCANHGLTTNDSVVLSFDTLATGTPRPYSPSFVSYFNQVTVVNSSSFTVVAAAQTAATGNCTIHPETQLRFPGVYGDGSNSFDHTVISERLWGGLDKAELLIFKGNDAGTSIQDNIRLAATGDIYFQSGVPGAASLYGNYISNYGSNVNSSTVSILANGNVGIGTTNPGTKLAVNGFITENPGDGTYWNVVTQKDIGFNANQVPLNQYLGQLAFADTYSPSGLRRDGGGADDLVVNSSGFVGIGTTNPGVPLEVFGSGPHLRIASNATSGYGYIQLGRSATASQNWHFGSEGNNYLNFWGGNWNSGTGPLLSLYSAGSTTTHAVLINNQALTGTASQPLQVNGGTYISGNVGIGITNPSDKLQVGGTISATGVSATGDINLGGELNFGGTPSGKVIDFYTKNSAGTNFGALFRLVNHDSTIFHNALYMIREGAVELYHNNVKRLETTAGGVFVGNAVLGANVGDTLTVADFFHGNGNASYVRIRARRNTTTQTWTGASTKILHVTDVTEQGYIEFNPNGSLNGLAFGQGGTEFARFLDSGNLGIGTTNPTRKFHVQGTSTFSSNVRVGTIIEQVPYDSLNGGTLSWEGSAGQLFSITNSLTTGSIFSVNDVSGIPSIDVDANGAIKLGPFGGTVTINNISIGRGGGTNVTNTAFGTNALLLNTSYQNTAVGFYSLLNNTTGNSNTAIGHSTLTSNTGGYQNIAIGVASLTLNTNGADNIAIGAPCLRNNTTGSGNTASGAFSAYNNTTGSTNTIYGNSAFYNNTNGNYNLALGANALYNCNGGSGNIGFGGANSSGSYLPTFNVTTENNRIVMGSTSVTNAYIQVAWTVVSDSRDKINFAPVPHGLDFVNALKPTAYQFKFDRDSDEANGPIRYGFLAQDILALEGDNSVIIDSEDSEKLRYNGESLVPVLVNAIQELTDMVKTLQNELAILKGVQQ